MTCPICWQLGGEGSRYHGRCLEQLLGTGREPAIPFGLADFPGLGLKLVGRSSLAGIGQKVLADLVGDRLEVCPGGRFILKPQSDNSTYAAVPENEALTLALARRVEIRTVLCGLFQLADKSWALLVRRFDRTDSGGRLRFEDFCQLSRLPPKAKYDGSAELCAKVVRAYAAAPRIELVALFRRFVFAWWVGDGDLHLKNLGLLEDSPGGKFSLAPAYDLVTSGFYPGLDNGLAMPVGGKATNLTRGTWREFARHCEVPDRVAGKILDAMVEAERPALDLISRSLLPEAFKAEYADFITHRTDVLSARPVRARKAYP